MQKYLYILCIIAKCFACGEWRMRTATKQLQHNDKEWSVMGRVCVKDKKIHNLYKNNIKHQRLASIQ